MLSRQGYADNAYESTELRCRMPDEPADIYRLADDEWSFYCGVGNEVTSELSFP